MNNKHRRVGVGEADRLRQYVWEGNFRIDLQI